MNTSDFVSGTFVLFILGVLIACIVALPTMWLWNWLMPDIFGLPTIGFWQAIGLNILSHIMFKSPAASNK